MPHDLQFLGDLLSPVESADDRARQRQMEEEDALVAQRERRERLAAYAHEAWSGWMAYLYGKAEIHQDGTWTIPAWATKRWLRQMTTPYADLPAGEQASDLAEADKMLAIFEER